MKSKSLAVKASRFLMLACARYARGKATTIEVEIAVVGFQHAVAVERVAALPETPAELRPTRPDPPRPDWNAR